MIRKTTRTSIGFACFVLLLLPSLAFAQLIFRDDFNRTALGPDWIAPAGTQWSVRNQSAYNFYDGVGATLLTAKKYSENRYVIETEASPFPNGYFRQYSLLFGKPQAGGDFGYVLKYQPYYNQGLILGRADGNEYSPTVLASKVMPLDPAKSIRFRIERFASGQIKVFVNSGSGYTAEPVLEAFDNTYNTLGHTGWRIDTETAAVGFYVNWFEVRALPALVTKITPASGYAYGVGILAPNVPVYTDRPYTYTSVPDNLSGASLIQPKNDDKNDTRNSFLSFKLAGQSDVYVLYDRRASKLPAWLQSWQKLPGQVYLNDGGANYFNTYKKTFPAGTVTFGANLAAPAAGAMTNYVVVVKPAAALARLAATGESAGIATQSETGTFPNPAQSSTTIRYQVAQESAVKVNLFDLQGKLISTVVDEVQAAGMHEKELNLNGLSEGLYIYKIQAGENSDTGKLLVIK